MDVSAPISSGLLYGPEALRAPKKTAAPSPDLSAQEQDVLAQERALKASAAGGDTSTTYIYATDAEGKRYIVGAQVTITGSEDVMNRVPGGKASESRNLEPSGKAAGPDREAAKPGGEAETEIAKLKQTEREVIAHEAAHQAVAGRFGGPVSYTYTTGPDGKRYITGGEVPINTPATSDPEEALRNAQQVLRAAMAPGDPSGQDVSVAASAAQTAASARAELAQEGPESSRGTSENAQKISAYAKQVSPKGLWTIQNGYENGGKEQGQNEAVAAFGELGAPAAPPNALGMDNQDDDPRGPFEIAA